jgi:hypothetical protein
MRSQFKTEWNGDTKVPKYFHLPSKLRATSTTPKRPDIKKSTIRPGETIRKSHAPLSIEDLEVTPPWKTSSVKIVDEDSPVKARPPAQDPVELFIKQKMKDHPYFNKSESPAHSVTQLRHARNPDVVSRMPIQQRNPHRFHPRDYEGIRRANILMHPESKYGVAKHIVEITEDLLQFLIQVWFTMCVDQIGSNERPPSSRALCKTPQSETERLP